MKLEIACDNNILISLQRYHPDSNESGTADVAKFRKVSEAYKILGNVQNRQAYDERERLILVFITIL